MPDIITINGKSIKKGEIAHVDLQIARLPTHTLIDLPIYVFRAKKSGPALLLTAGLHGDELNGIEIIRRMIADKSINPSIGSVIAVPIVNIYGFLNNSRDLPDGKDLNRSFPGTKGGSLAYRLAYIIMNEVLSHVDYAVDFHTGGTSRANYPQIRCVLGSEENFRLARAFAPPFIVNSKMIDRSFRKEAIRKGINALVFEAGETLRFDELAISEGINGTIRLMHNLGMIPYSLPPNDSIMISRAWWMRARSAGLFRAFIKPGEQIYNKQLLASITDPFGEVEIKIYSNINGYVIGINTKPVVNTGDAILHVGKEDKSPLPKR